jgi:hypothetical protein
MTIETIALAWPIVSGVINVVLRTRTPEEWVELNDRSPRLAAFTRLLRAIGVDPVKMVKAIGDMVSGGKP